MGLGGFELFFSFGGSFVCFGDWEFEGNGRCGEGEGGEERRRRRSMIGVEGREE